MNIKNSFSNIIQSKSLFRGFFRIYLFNAKLANKTRIESYIFKSVVFNAIRNSTVFGILIKIIGKHDKETTSDLKKTFNENLKVISSDLKMFNASETRNLGRYQDGISNL